MVQLWRYMLRPYPFFAEGRRRWGDPFTAQLAGYGTFVFLGDPQSIRDVFHGDPDVLHSGEANAFMADTLGPSSLLVLDGAAHGRQRRALMPPFHGDRMRAHTAAMQAAADREIDGWREGERVGLEEACRRITRDVILRAIFGLDSGGSPERFRRLSDRVAHYLDLVDSPFGLLAPLIPRPLRALTRWRAILRAQSGIDTELHALVSERRAGAGGGGDDVLSELLRMVHDDGAPLSDSELRDHLFTFLLAGHDTTAVALGWAFDQILGHPEVLARISDELERFCPQGRLDDERLRRLVYLDGAVKESLRVRPVVPFVVRLLQSPFDAGGTRYPAGVHLAPCALMSHFRPDVYPDPHRFEPERFVGRRPDPARWLPFGGGVRRCTGMQLALHEMKVVLATVLARVELAAEGRPPARPRRRGLLLSASDGTTVTVRRRR